MTRSKLTRAFLIGTLLVLALTGCVPGTDDDGDDNDDDARVPVVFQLA